MKKTGLMVAALALALTAACGGGSDRPSKSEVSKALTSSDSVVGTVPKDKADCLAKILVDSKLSDKTLKALVDKDKDYKGTSADTKIINSLGTKAQSECK